MRGFVYVLSDQTTLTVATSAFHPALVALESPEVFLGHSQLVGARVGTGGGGVENLTSLQRIYAHRASVQRVVYAVSCAHPNMEALTEDLGRYKVLQRGDANTPSEQIEVVCFERPNGWLDHAKTCGRGMVKDLTSKGANNAVVHTGVVVATSMSQLDDGSESGLVLSIAVDYSNDVVNVPVRQVRRLLEWLPSRLRDEGSAAGAGKSSLTPGCRVEFTTASVQRGGTSDELFSNRCHHEVLLIAARAQDSVTHALYPVIIGRSSYPTPAVDYDTPTHEDTTHSLKGTLVRAAEASIGRLAAHAFHRRAGRAAWAEGLLLHRARLRDLFASSKFEAKDSDNLSLVAAFAPVDVPNTAAALRLYLALHNALRVNANHVLMKYLDGVLGDHTQALPYFTLDSTLLHFRSCQPHLTIIQPLPNPYPILPRRTRIRSGQIKTNFEGGQRFSRHVDRGVGELPAKFAASYWITRRRHLQ